MTTPYTIIGETGTRSLDGVHVAIRSATYDDELDVYDDNIDVPFQTLPTRNNPDHAQLDISKLNDKKIIVTVEIDGNFNWRVNETKGRAGKRCAHVQVFVDGIKVADACILRTKRKDRRLVFKKAIYFDTNQNKHRQHHMEFKQAPDMSYWHSERGPGDPSTPALVNQYVSAEQRRYTKAEAKNAGTISVLVCPSIHVLKRFEDVPMVEHARHGCGREFGKLFEYLTPSFMHPTGSQRSGLPQVRNLVYLGDQQSPPDQQIYATEGMQWPACRPFLIDPEFVGGGNHQVSLTWEYRIRAHQGLRLPGVLHDIANVQMVNSPALAWVTTAGNPDRFRTLRPRGPGGAARRIDLINNRDEGRRLVDARQQTRAAALAARLAAQAAAAAAGLPPPAAAAAAARPARRRRRRRLNW